MPELIKSLLPWALILIVIALIVKVLELKKSQSNANQSNEDGNEKLSELNNLPYIKKQYLFTKHELHFYKTLKPITDSMKLSIFSKVRLADIVYTKKGTENYSGWFNRIKSKHIDFVLCTAEYINPVLMIELDDSSHDTPSRQLRDKFVDNVAKTANIPLLHIRNFSPESLKTEIEKALNIQP